MKKTKTKNYTLQLPEKNIKRLWYLRDISNNKFNPNELINKAINDILKKYEKIYNVEENTFLISPKCNKCGGAMRKVEYQEKPFWGCADFPKCKNLKPMKEDE